MNELQNQVRSDSRQSPLVFKERGTSNVLKAIVIVLAVIGALALIAVAGMFWMHDSMMSGMDSMGMGMGRR